MNKSIQLLHTIVYLLFFGLQTACVPEEKEERLGILQLQIGINEEVAVETKAGTTTQLDSCKVFIKNNNGDIIRKYENAATMPVEEWLIAGRYVVEAFLGTPKKAEFDHPCYVGEATVDIIANKSVSKDIVCKLSQSKVSVVYEKGITSNFKNYTTTVAMGISKLEFQKDSTKIGYFYNSTEEKQNLVCTITASPASGTAVSKEYIIQNIKPCTHYVIHADYNTDISEGGFKFEIEVQEQPAGQPDDKVDIPISKYPTIAIKDETVDGKYIFGQIAAGMEFVTMTVKGYPKINNLVLSGDYLERALQLTSSIDFLALEESAKLELRARGFEYSIDNDETDIYKHERMTIKIPVPQAKLVDGLLCVKVVDSKNQYREKKDINVIVTDLHVSTSATIPYETWSTWSVIRGTKNAGATVTETISFEYRKIDTDQWKEVVSSTDADTYYALITDLTPGAIYQYRIKEGGKTAKIETFTTEGQTQLPNSSFNDWFKDDGLWRPWATGEQSFWGCGNTKVSIGITITTNLTTPDPEVGVERMALMETKYVSIKVGAGNLFTGEFALNGTDGIITLGRSFDSRPIRLKGKYKYKPAIFSNNDDYKGLPSELGIELKNKPDTCSLYIALTSDLITIKTKESERQLFDKNDPKIIAFGEMGKMQTVESTGNDLIPFSIDLEYRTTNEKPKYIIIVCAASKYGDYYVGARGSKMWVDDFKLEYPNEVPTIK